MNRPNDDLADPNEVPTPWTGTARELLETIEAWHRATLIDASREVNTAHDMGALEQVDALRVKKDPDFARHITAGQEHAAREDTRHRIARWWHTR